MKKTFILSDQTLNCYGFVVLTNGISLERFKKNPVMLYNHKNTDQPEEVIGKWDNLRVQGEQLLADENIDRDEDFSLRVAKKVDKDLIRCASIRLDYEFQDIKLDLNGFEGVPVITKSELVEASIVSIPGNKNAVRLFCDGKPVEDEQLALSLTHKPNPQDNNMKKILLFAQVLGMTLSADATEDHVLEGVKTLAQERDSLKLKVDELNKKIGEAEDKLKEEANRKVTQLIEDAVTAKKLSAEQKDHFLKLAALDFDTTKSIIEKMVPHKTISEQLNNGGAGAGAKSPFEGKKLEELMKSNEGSKYLAKLRAGSAEEKAEYSRLFEEKHGKKPNI